MNTDEYNIGQLADGILAELTLVEETIDQVERGHRPWREEVEQSVINLDKAQKMAAEILRRHEEEAGPIEAY